MHNAPPPGPSAEEPSPFEVFQRENWAELATSTPLPLTDEDVRNLTSLGDPLDLDEVDAIYRPISALLQMYVDSNRRLGLDRHYFLREPQRPPTPFIIGVAGSVAVGKSSTARLLRELLRRWPHTPRVQLITTDGFLHPNAELWIRRASLNPMTVGSCWISCRRLSRGRRKCAPPCTHT